MAQGRGNAYAAAAMLLVIIGLQSCCLWHQASAATYTVGGSKGWDTGVDYTTWAAGKVFHDGDILFFPYTQGEHDVLVVAKAGYDACSGANAVNTYSTGNTNVTLTGTGAHYYLCSVVGHCSAGMKLAVTVTATAAAPTASPPAAIPTASPPASAPAPSKKPSSSPTKPPSSARSPTSPPSSAPAPSPTVKSPITTPSSSPAPSPTVESPIPSPSSPASSPRAPAVATPSSPGTPTSSPPPSPPNAAPSLLVSAACVPLLTVLAAVLAL